jgi:hypothetical protein
MMVNSRILRILALIALVPGLTSCGECRYVRMTQAWVDENENGIFDDGEKPFEDVTITVSYPGETSSMITNEEGRAGIFLPYNCGFGFSIAITASVPDGFRATTPESLTVHTSDDTLDEGPIPFGFVPDP